MAVSWSSRDNSRRQRGNKSNWNNRTLGGVSIRGGLKSLGNMNSQSYDTEALAEARKGRIQGGHESPANTTNNPTFGSGVATHIQTAIRPHRNNSAHAYA